MPFLRIDVTNHPYIKAANDYLAANKVSIQINKQDTWRPLCIFNIMVEGQSILTMNLMGRGVGCNRLIGQQKAFLKLIIQSPDQKLR